MAIFSQSCRAWVVIKQYARQSSVSTFKKEVDEYCWHLRQRELKQGLMYSNYSGLKVRNSIMTMLAPYPRKVSVKTLRVLMNDFEVREVLFRSKKSKTDICPYCRVVDNTAHFLFSCVSYQKHRRSFIKELQNQNIDETLVGLLNCENKHDINALAGFIASKEFNPNTNYLNQLPIIDSFQPITN